MLVSEAITEIREKINDVDVVEYTDTELLNNLNEAVQYVGTYLVGVNSPVATEEMNVTQASFNLPQNFTKLCGNYPLKVKGNTATLLVTPPLKVKYFVTPGKLIATDSMPFNHDALWQVIIKLAAIYAENRNEYDIQQDKALLDEVNARLAAIV